MIVNTISNSSPPLRGRGLLADDDKCQKEIRIRKNIHNWLKSKEKTK
jgi:hypothetical protein